jgi:arylsulfatase A-like enzyme
MKTRHFLSIILAFVVLLASMNGLAQENQKTNIILFYVDDMGWQDCSEPFYTEVTQLNKNYHTPQMEQLAKEGMKFTQAYACAVCSPSRISLMTGMNAARHR